MTDTPEVAEQEALRLLRQGVVEAGTQQVYAESLGLGQSYLSQMLSGYRRISVKVFHALGLEVPRRTPQSEILVRARAAKKPPKPVAERFWPKVRKTEKCWLWTGACSPAGYGQVAMTRGSRQAHRISWELHYGPVPDGLVVCHHCDNPPCVNPAHLFVGTASDNMRDMVTKGRSKEQRAWYRQHTVEGDNPE